MKPFNIYLREEHFEYFKKHPELSISGLIRQLLDKHIEKVKKK